MTAREPLASPDARDAILETVAFAARRLLEAETWESAMPDVLQHLGTAAGASRAYLFRNRARDDGALCTSMVFEWCAPGIRSVADEPPSKDSPWIASGFGRWVERMERDEPVYGLVEDFPEPERRELAAQDVVSILCFPITVRGTWWGTIGFDECERQREWLPGEIVALRAAAGIVSARILRQQIEEELRETRERFRAIVEHGPVITYQERIDRSREHVELLYISPQVADVFGYPVERWLDPSFWPGLVHPDDYDAVMAEDERTVGQELPFDMEYRMIARDRREVWIHDVAIPIKGTSEDMSMWQGFMIDVTERKAAQAALERVEGRLRLLTEHIPAITYIDLADEDSKTIYVSHQIEEILGYTQQDWIDDNDFWHRHLHPDDREWVWRTWRECVDGGRAFDEEYRMVHRDGHTVWISEHSVVLPNRDGGPPTLQGVLIDVTERRRAEEQARRAEERFRRIVDRVPVATYIENTEAAPEGFFISPQIEDITGFPPDAFLDPGFWGSHIHPEDRERVLAFDRETDQTGRDFDTEYRFLRADGNVVWIHEQAVRLEDESGRPAWWGVMADITDLKRAEQDRERALAEEREARRRLQELDDLKNTLLRAVSHDVRTPLSALLGLAVTLARPDLSLPDEERRELAARIVVNARKLDRLVGDLLDLDRLMRNELRLQCRPVELGELVHRLVGESDAIRGREVYVQSSPATAWADPAKVERIVDNLLANAAKHTPPGARLWIETRPEDDGVLLIVEDDGPGVPEPESETIFDLYARGGDAPGSGVGLAIVRRFAELHGGRAWVEERRGGGASFRVWLPAGDPIND